MRRTSIVALTFGLLASAGCAHAPRTPGPRPALTVRMPRAAPEILEALRIGAVRGGFRIAAETADSVHVDFGVSLVDLPVPTVPGDDRSPTRMRRTEVHAEAIYQVSPLEAGAVVTLHDDPIYWHPDSSAWFPAPSGLAPGVLFLARVAGRGSE